MPKRPLKLPVILRPKEVMNFLKSVTNLKHRMLLTAAYAAGLRVSEATHLKVTDIDSERMMVRVDQGKGNKDRYVMRSPRLLNVLRLCWKAARPRHLQNIWHRPERPNGLFTPNPRSVALNRCWNTLADTRIA